uniref:Uncharacterized protein n=1 Tax=Aegilops tauschii subsp. strangulata TaxID=200361 RepID=A0A453MX43_AEGTS
MHGTEFFIYVKMWCGVVHLIQQKLWFDQAEGSPPSCSLELFNARIQSSCGNGALY